MEKIRPAAGLDVQAAGLFCIRLSLRNKPGFCPRHQKSLGNQAVAGLHFWQTRNDVEDAHTRKPMLLLRLFGLLLLRYAQRALFRLLLNEPPRRTRLHRANPSLRAIHQNYSGWFGNYVFHPASKQTTDLCHHGRSMLVLTGGEPFPFLAQA